MSSIVVRQKNAVATPRQSKLGGHPDVPDGFVWPNSTYDWGDIFDFDFLCQFRCADLAKYDKDGLLPHTGMLYFFYDFTMQRGHVEDLNAARVLYFEEEEDLWEFLLTDEEGNELTVCRPRALAFSHFKREDKDPDMYMPLTEDVEEGYISLLSISSFRAGDGRLHFTDKGRLWFLIKPEDLAKCDFSDVRVKVKRFKEAEESSEEE